MGKFLSILRFSVPKTVIKWRVQQTTQTRNTLLFPDIGLLNDSKAVTRSCLHGIYRMNIYTSPCASSVLGPLKGPSQN
jgi:hypothetical protein